LKQLTAADDGYDDLKGRWDELWARLTPAWRTVVGRSPIENCSLSFKFRCPKQWDKLLRTEVAAVRFCESCQQRVFYCGSIDEARGHAMAGECVALDVEVARWPGDLSDEGRLLGALAMDDLDDLDDLYDR